MQRRWIELFEGNGRRLSMSRLLVFLAFWPASYAFMKNPSVEMAAVYLGAFVLNYIGGKSADVFMGVEKLEAVGGNVGGNDGSATGASLAGESQPVSRGKKRPF